MKHLARTFLFFLLLLSNHSFSQSIAVNSTDKVTGARVITTRSTKGGVLNLDESIVRSGAVFFSAGYLSSVAAGKVKGSYFIELEIVHNDNRLGCLPEKTGKIILTLRDGSEMECFQISPSDCDKTAFKAAYALMKRGGTDAEMKANFEKLSTIDITGIKIQTSEKEINFKVKTNSRELIKKHFLLVDKTVKAGK
jgi:hypothetical protein